MIDASGQRFGRLTALREVERQGKHRRYLCRCDCGVEKAVNLGHLRRGAVVSCGCYAKERARSTRRKHGLFVNHAGDPNEARTRLYSVWVNLRQRCENPANPRYARYGGRGIAVCRQWADFARFRDWALANGYRDDLTLDRIDNDGPYEPENCRWATYAVQRRNRPDAYQVPVGGRVLTLAEASQELGVSKTRLRNHIRRYGAVNAVTRITQEVLR